MADWEEIKRLAADFQRTQTSDTLQRISERNCIDIVKKLTDLHLIELIYTCDGKEFLTPDHLQREIEDEVYVNGGRMHLHDLAARLNVDYQHVETKSTELARDRSDEYSLILGQIIHSTYKTTLGKQIHDCMLINGQLSIADFAKTLDLPSEFLLTIVKEMLPKVMDDYVVGQDERTFYTTDHMNRYKSIIAGTLSAIMKPTSIASIMKRLDISERIFMPIVERLIKEGRVDATIENRTFVPSIHAREQNNWITSFYSSNSYVAYDMLLRMDIKQPKAFLKKKFPDGMQLKTCYVEPNLSSQVESLIEDSIASNSFIDVTTIVPPAIEAEDIELLLQDIFKRNKQFDTSSKILNKTTVCSFGYITSCKNFFNNLMQSKAQDALKQGKLVEYFLGAKPKTKPQPVQSKPEQEPELKPDQDQSEPSAEPSVDNKEVTPKTPKNEHKQSEQKDKGSDDDDDEKSGKKSKSRKSGGGFQGREIKQKAIKKKYIPGNKGNQKNNADASDEESQPSKSRSNKGRAARRNISPERPSSHQLASKSKGNQQQQQEIAVHKEPLIFMSTEEIIDKLKHGSREADESGEDFYESIAKLIEIELNTTYKTLARQVLDEFLKSQSEETHQDNAEDVDLVE